MKIRQGFVSNSSSSSFIALGFCFDEESPYRKIAKHLGVLEEFDTKVKEYLDKDYYDEDDMGEIEREVDYDIDMTKSYDIRVLQGGEDGVGDSNVVALMLAETDSYDGGDFPRGEVVMDESNSDYCKITKLRDDVSPDANIKILYGTRCC